MKMNVNNEKETETEMVLRWSKEIGNGLQKLVKIGNEDPGTSGPPHPPSPKVEQPLLLENLGVLLSIMILEIVHMNKIVKPHVQNCMNSMRLLTYFWEGDVFLLIRLAHTHVSDALDILN